MLVVALIAADAVAGCRGVGADWLATVTGELEVVADSAAPDRDAFEALVDATRVGLPCVRTSIDPAVWARWQATTAGLWYSFGDDRWKPPARVALDLSPEPGVVVQRLEPRLAAAPPRRRLPEGTTLDTEPTAPDGVVAGVHALQRRRGRGVRTRLLEDAPVPLGWWHPGTTTVTVGPALSVWRTPDGFVDAGGPSAGATLAGRAELPVTPGLRTALRATVAAAGPVPQAAAAADLTTAGAARAAVGVRAAGLRVADGNGDRPLVAVTPHLGLDWDAGRVSADARAWWMPWLVGGRASVLVDVVGAFVVGGRASWDHLSLVDGPEAASMDAV